MKKFWLGWVALWAVVAVSAAEPRRVTVTGDRVSLRAAPSLNAVLLDRAMRGDELVLKDDSNPDWVGVVPPESVDLWVLGDYLDGESVLPVKLNVRSGPSLSHSVVGVVVAGQQLSVRGEASGWVRIAPPAETIVWLSRQFVTGAEPLVQVVFAPQSDRSDAPKIPHVQIVDLEPVPEEPAMIVAADPGPKLPAVLVPDDTKKQGAPMNFSGILRPAEGLFFKLVNRDVESVTVCYVRGNSEQMKRLSGQTVSLTGPAYWAVGLELPFIRPVLIRQLISAR